MTCFKFFFKEILFFCILYKILWNFLLNKISTALKQ